MVCKNNHFSLRWDYPASPPPQLPVCRSILNSPGAIGKWQQLIQACKTYLLSVKITWSVSRAFKMASVLLGILSLNNYSIYWTILREEKPVVPLGIELTYPAMILMFYATPHQPTHHLFPGPQRLPSPTSHFSHTSITSKLSYIRKTSLR